MRRVLGFRAGALALVSGVLLAGCKTMPTVATDATAPAAAATLMDQLPPPALRTWADEKADVLNQRARGYGLVRMPEMQAYLNGLLQRIKAQAGVPGWAGSVHIVATSSLEAYATAAGNIYVSPAWLSSVESEDELVALLAHEFGHIYLHFHQLEGALQDADQTMALGGVAVALASRSVAAAGWTPVDTLLSAYAAGRSLTVSAWSRNQEAAADHFALYVSERLGYTYEHGMKAFLERLASWEEINEKRQRDMEAQLQIKLREEALAHAQAKAAQPNGLHPSLVQPSADINVGIHNFINAIFKPVREGVALATSSHPSTTQRLETLAAMAERLPSAQVPREAVVAPLTRARAQKQTEEILRHYRLSDEVLQNLDHPQAVERARRAASGATARHALPLLAYHRALVAQQARVRGQRPAVDPGAPLEANLGAEEDRAWAVYLESSRWLQATGRGGDARRVMAAGIAFFDAAPDAWPSFIQFQGQSQGWALAKRSAQVCQSRFKTMEKQCQRAAASPAELAQAERLEKAKADALSKKLFKP